MPRAILFDLDDTLTDRRPSLVRYAQIFAADFHHSLAAPAWQAAHSAIVEVDELGYAPRENVFRALQSQLAWRQAPELQRLADHWQQIFPRTTTPREGALEVLHELRRRGFLIGVVTNGRTVIQRPKLETLGIIPLLDCIVVSEEAGYHKPHAAPFVRALSDLQCESGDAWFVGDHPRNDIFGASAAGMKAIWLRGIHPWPANDPPPERHIDAIADLLPLIDLP
jgi:putative hydrolase of the HAD superfamily